MEPFYGCNNAQALVQALIDRDYPYLVILDGDYRILKPAKNTHRCVLILERYSFENYLWEHDPVNRACLRHARCGENKDLVRVEMERIVAQLKKELPHAVALDVAARRSPSPPAVLPDAMEQLALNNVEPDLDPAKVATLLTRVEPQLNSIEVKAAKAEVRNFLSTRCITHLLKGHIILGILRRLFLRAAEAESGTKSSLPSDAFTQILSEMVWRRCKSDDHHRLKRSLRAKIRKLIPRYPTQAQPAAASGP